MKQADVIFFLWSVGLVALQPVFFHTTTQSTNSVYEAMKRADVIFLFGLWGWLPYNQCFFIQPPGIKSCDLNICESASTYKTTNMGGGGVGWAVGGVT